MNGSRGFTGARALLACLLIGAGYSVHKGQDASWDLRNYHLYNPWALLHGRLGVDLAPASLQTYFNPLLDLPYYLLGTGPLQHLPRVLAGFQGLWFGGLIFMVLQIARRLAHLQARRFGVADLCAVLIGTTGTMTLSQVGLSSNEMPLALLVIGALYLLLPCGPQAGISPRRVFLAGLLCGLAAGLKPTAVVYPPALAIGLLVGLDGRVSAWRMSALFTAAAASGFALAYGWWGWRLYQLTGNPIFPIFNQVFHSPWVPPASVTDVRFLPRGVGQWLFYPFYWLQANRGLVTEPRFADPRYALAMLALCMMAVTGWLRRGSPPTPARPAVRLITVFVVLSYVAWLVLFSILRYAIPIEVLCGVLVMLAWQAISPGAASGGVALRWGTVALLVAVATPSRLPNWGHARYADVVFDVRLPSLAPNSVVVVVGQPNAYLIPFFGQAQASRFVGVTWLSAQSQSYTLGARVRQQLASHEGPMYALLRDDAGAERKVLARWLPGRRLGGCRPVSSALERTGGGTDVSGGLRLCGLVRVVQ